MEKPNLRAKTSTAIVEMEGCFPNQNQYEDDEHQVKAAASGELPLPPELIYDILCRLPAKSVGRFRCVSKNWQTLLSDPQFLNIQFTRNNHQTKLILPQNYSLLSIDFREDCNSSNDPVAICETLSFKPTNLRYTIRGSCNGLLLLHDSKNFELSIANPITHESRQLPALPKSILRHSCIFGFGYCSNDDEYTVVIISDYTCSSPVFILKGNLWKRVENSPLGIVTICGAFVNGAMHWVSHHPKKIYSFDLAGERFREVELPEGLKKEYDFLVDTLGGCLCLVVHHIYLENDIWVMKEYGVRESWTKYVARSSFDFMYIQPLFFWNGDESIVAVDAERLVLWCLKQETLASIPVIGERPSLYSYVGLWTFVDSLFSPNGSNAVEGPNQIHV